MRLNGAMTTYTVTTSSTADTERVSSVGDGRHYGHSTIWVKDAEGGTAAYYEMRRSFGGGEARAEITVDGVRRTFYSVPRERRAEFRTLRAWFRAEIADQFGVKVSR